MSKLIRGPYRRVATLACRFGQAPHLASVPEGTAPVAIPDIKKMGARTSILAIVYQVKSVPDLDPLLAMPIVPVLVALGASVLVQFSKKGPVPEGTLPNTLVSIGLWFIGPLLFAGYVNEILSAVRSAYDSLCIPRLPASLWTGLPVMLVILITLTCHDFCDYWNHRLMHLRWVFPVHAVHHSDTHVDGLTTFRAHGLEKVVMQTSYILLISWMNVPALPAVGLWFLVTLHNCYVHLDLDWSHGPFRHVLASPRFHRWHHADVPIAYGKNLANILPIWDVMFGTYINPGPCTAPMGSREMDIPSTNLPRLLIWPVIGWVRLIREAIGTRAKQGSFGPAATEALS